MRLKIEWEIEVREKYSGTVELPAEVVERVNALRAEDPDLTLDEAIATYETESDFEFDLESLVLDEETDVNMIDTSTLDRSILTVEETADEPVPTVYDHDARPDDDNEPGDRCKECGEDITWTGPSTADYLHVNDARNQ